MQTQEQRDGEEKNDQETDDNMWTAIGRAFAGALIFSMPILMTMETWWLGFAMNRWQLILFILVNMAFLVGIAYYRGFHDDVNWQEAIIDAFVGYAIGVVAALCFLVLFGVITWEMSADEIVGKIALLAIPGAIGALLARSQLVEKERNPEEKPENAQGYWAEIFIMIAGSLFISYTVAPTEEMLLIAYQMTPWHALAAVIGSLLILHIFVYKVEFRGQHSAPEESSGWSLFLYFTVVGYLAVFLTSLYLLWSYGRITGVEVPMILMYGIVLSVPGALGAAAARLIL
jgi:putative integral membrane protein (TIGR02587 family)